MTDELGDQKSIDLLTEPEAAQLLRCSTSKIKRLRLSGKLAYLPGRPLYIERQALKDYIDAVRVPARTTAAREMTPEGQAEKLRRSTAEARQWALKKVLTRRQRSR